MTATLTLAPGLATPPPAAATPAAPPPVPRRYTFEEWRAIDNEDREYELVDGVLEELHVSALTSIVASRVGFLLRQHNEPLNLGEIFESEMIFRCFPWKPDNGRKPDVAYIALERLPPHLNRVGYFTIPPDLAVEVLSPNDLASSVQRKLSDYIAAKVRLIWFIEPEERTVVVYRLDGSYARLSEADELGGEDVIPGFRCRVADLFPRRATPGESAQTPAVPTANGEPL